MAQQGEDVYCTLLLTDSYLPGASVLANSLRDAGTTKKLAVLVALDVLTAAAVTELKALYDYVIPVERIANPNPSALYLMDRADLAFAFTKIHLWRQRQFRKIVYLDADMVALRAPDELFDIAAPFAAAPDIGWPDAFNTGVMVISPDMGDYAALRTLAAGGDSFDGADQGLLNQYYQHRPWQRISFTYNCTPSAHYQWEPAYRYYKSNITMAHFIGKQKPWLGGRPARGAPGVYNELLARWWAVYDRHLKPPATTNMFGLLPPASAVMQWPEDRGEGQGAYHGYASSEQVVSVPQAAPEVPAEEPRPSDSVDVPTEQRHKEASGNDDLTTQFQSLSTSEPSRPVESSPDVTMAVPDERRDSSMTQMQWDATRAAPPVQSRPEAANFPVQIYKFSEDRELFRAPQAYPEPPKDMYYEVPAEKPSLSDKPKPIFPWEANPAKPTRVFADDTPPPIEAEPSLPTDSVLDESAEETAVSESDATTFSSETSGDTWAGFTHTSNAWDAVPGIEKYVRAVKNAQNKRGKPEISPVTANFGALEITGRIGARAQGRARRESLILTDFPTEIERPSLPVTPAPIRRPSFWGEERDGADDMPAAEGVPDQADWDPTEKLEELRRNSLLGPEQLIPPAVRAPSVPLRELPEHSAPLKPKEGLEPTEGLGGQQQKPVMAESSSTHPAEPQESGGVEAFASAPADVTAQGAPLPNRGTIFGAAHFGSLNEDTPEGTLAGRDTLISPTER